MIYEIDEKTTYEELVGIAKRHLIVATGERLEHLHNQSKLVPKGGILIRQGTFDKNGDLKHFGRIDFDKDVDVKMGVVFRRATRYVEKKKWLNWLMKKALVGQWVAFDGDRVVGVYKTIGTAKRHSGDFRQIKEEDVAIMDDACYPVNAIIRDHRNKVLRDKAKSTFLEVFKDGKIKEYGCSRFDAVFEEKGFVASFYENAELKIKVTDWFLRKDVPDFLRLRDLCEKGVVESVEFNGDAIDVEVKDVSFLRDVRDCFFREGE